jgi:hypothetical protein
VRANAGSAKKAAERARNGRSGPKPKKIDKREQQKTRSEENSSKEKRNNTIAARSTKQRKLRENE